MFSYHVSNFQKNFLLPRLPGRTPARMVAISCQICLYDSLSFAIPSNPCALIDFQGGGGGGGRQTRITDLSLKIKIEGVQKRRPLLEILSEK